MDDMELRLLAVREAGKIPHKDAQDLMLAIDYIYAFLKDGTGVVERTGLTVSIDRISVARPVPAQTHPSLPNNRLADRPLTPFQQSVMDAMNEMDERGMDLYATAIANYMGLDASKATNVHATLRTFEQRGLCRIYKDGTRNVVKLLDPDAGEDDDDADAGADAPAEKKSADPAGRQAGEHHLSGHGADSAGSVDVPGACADAADEESGSDDQDDRGRVSSALVHHLQPGLRHGDDHGGSKVRPGDINPLLDDEGLHRRTLNMIVSKWLATRKRSSLRELRIELGADQDDFGEVLKWLRENGYIRYEGLDIAVPVKNANGTHI